MRSLPGAVWVALLVGLVVLAPLALWRHGVSVYDTLPLAPSHDLQCQETPTDAAAAAPTGTGTSASTEMADGGCPCAPHEDADALMLLGSLVVRQTETLGRLPPDLRDGKDPVAPDVPDDLARALLPPPPPAGAGAAAAATAAAERMVVATTSCGEDGIEDVVTWLKALLLFGAGADTPLAETLTLLDVHIFADTTSASLIRTVVGWWQLPVPLALTLHTPTMPPGVRDLFKPCALQRLFLADLLPASITRVLYLDRDTLVLGDLRPLWLQTRRLGASGAKGGQPERLLALTIETDTPARSYYRTARTAINPWGLGGLNSGVLLADLAAWRTHNISQGAWMDIYRARRADLYLGDQDLLNIFYHTYPDHVLPLSCRWNYRSDCRDARMSVLHLNRQAHRKDRDTFPGHAWQAVLSWPLLPLPRHIIMAALEAARNATAATSDSYRTGWESFPASV
jgi:hypothetical protein